MYESPDGWKQYTESWSVQTLMNMNGRGQLLFDWDKQRGAETLRKFANFIIVFPSGITSPFLIQLVAVEGEIPHSCKVGIGFNPLISQIRIKLSINITKNIPQK